MIQKVWVTVYVEKWSNVGDGYIGVAASKETAQKLAAPNLTWVDNEDGTESTATLDMDSAYVVTETEVAP